MEMWLWWDAAHSSSSELCDEDESERRCSLSRQSLYAGSWHQIPCASSQKSKPLLGILVEPLALKLGRVLWEYSFDLSWFTLANMKLDYILLTLEDTRNFNTINKKVLERMLEMYFLRGPSFKIMFFIFYLPLIKEKVEICKPKQSSVFLLSLVLSIFFLFVLI